MKIRLVDTLQVVQHSSYRSEGRSLERVELLRKILLEKVKQVKIWKGSNLLALQEIKDTSTKIADYSAKTRVRIKSKKWMWQKSCICTWRGKFNWVLGVGFLLDVPCSPRLGELCEKEFWQGVVDNFWVPCYCGGRMQCELTKQTDLYGNWTRWDTSKIGKTTRTKKTNVATHPTPEW